MEERTARIKRQLYSKFYHMNDTWLNDCLDYYLTEHPNATDAESLTFVTAQWQLSDLREISNEKGCLPKNLAQQKSTMLPGKYILQVEKGYDISTPKYKQLEAMRKVSNENISVTDAEQTQGNWEIKSKRMMQLFLTDGIQDVSALEYQPIRFLKDVILPGFKIMIKGPVACRRGVILLAESNILEVGGEVEHLLISNATENVFARALNMPENPDPYNDIKQQAEEAAALFDEDFDIDLDEITQLESEAPVNVQPSRPQKSSSSLNPPKSISRPMDRSKPPDIPVGFQVDPELETGDLDFPDDDELFNLTGENDLQSNSRQSEDQPSNAGRNPVKSTIFTNSITPNKINNNLIVISDDESGDPREVASKNPPANVRASKQSEKTDENLEDLGNLDWEDFELEPDELLTVQAPAIAPKNRSEVVKPENSRLTLSFFDRSGTSGGNKNVGRMEASKTSSGIFSGGSGAPSTGQKRPSNLPGSSASKLLCSKNNSNSNQHTRGILNYFKKTEPTPKAEPPRICDFISELKQLSLTAGTVRKKIYGRTTYLGKLGKGERGWMLEGTLSDGTESLDVQFSSEVLERELGFTVAEFAVQKKQRKNNPEMEQKLRQIFRTADARLKNLDALVEVELSLDNKKPKVILISDLTDAQRKTIAESKKRLGYS